MGHFIGQHQEGVGSLIRHPGHGVEVLHHHIVVQEVRGYADQFGAFSFIRFHVHLQVPALVIQGLLEHQGGRAEQAVEEDIPVAVPVQVLQHLHLVFVKHADGVIGADFRILIVDAHIRNPLVIGIGRVTYRHFITRVHKVDRHDLQRLVLLVLQGKLIPFLQAIRGILISPEECRGRYIGMIAVGKRIRIICEAVKLFLQFRLFIQKIGNKSADSPVNHDHDHIFAFPVQPEGNVLRLDPGSNIPDLHCFFLHAVDVDHGHHHQGNTAIQAHNPQDHRMLPAQKAYSRNCGKHTARVQQHFPELVGDICLILQCGRDESVVFTEEHIVHCRGNRADRHKQRKPLTRLGRKQHTVQDSPEQECARRQQGGRKQVLGRVLVVMGIHKLCRGCPDQGGRNKHTRQDGHIQAAEDQQDFIVLIRFPLPFVQFHGLVSQLRQLPQQGEHSVSDPEQNQSAVLSQVFDGTEGCAAESPQSGKPAVGGIQAQQLDAPEHDRSSGFLPEIRLMLRFQRGGDQAEYQAQADDCHTRAHGHPGKKGAEHFKEQLHGFHRQCPQHCPYFHVLLPLSIVRSIMLPQVSAADN